MASTITDIPVRIISVFEWGLQPLTAATAGGYLESHAIPVSVDDVFVDAFHAARYEDAWLVAIAVPVYDAITGAITIARDIKALNPRAHLVFFGQYATVQYRELVPKYGDSAICGDWEEPLRQLAERLAAGVPLDGIPGLFVGTVAPIKYWARDQILPPARHLLPELRRYNMTDTPNGSVLQSTVSGNVEVTRGCHHDCSYCSVFAAYGRKVIVIPKESILQDIRTLVESGANHIVFVDADFLSAWKYSRSVVEAMCREFPQLTFEYTTRVDHMLEHPDVVAEFHDLGCTRVTSAFEFPKDEVLALLRKNCTVEDLEQTVRYCHNIGQALNPTFILFNPWVNPDDLLGFDEFIARNHLENVVEPIQYETRLMLYKGTPLLREPSIQALQLQENEFHIDWEHPDPLMDELYQSRVTPSEPGVFKRCCLKC